MEKYIVNGHEIEYDTFDLANIELLDSEIKRLTNKLANIQAENIPAENQFAFLHEISEDILDFFDTVVGEGTSQKVFEGKVNIRDLFSAFQKFNQDVKSNTASVFGAMNVTPLSPAVPANREQRRAAERAMRREKARQAATAKNQVLNNE